MRVLIAVLKMMGFIAITMVIVPTQILVLLVHKGRISYVLPCLWCDLLCRVFRIRFRVDGSPCLDKQTMFMSNHISYLDIVVLGSLLPASFLAKSEVASWPVFGFLSKLRQTAFINRKRTAIMAAKKSLDQRIAQGRSLIIFPEGTSTDGRSVYPFKSSLFALALGRHNDDLLVQPVTIRVDSSDGVAPKTQEERDIYAWHLHMDCSLAVHLWRFAKAGGAELSVIFHEPLRAATFEDRKTLANTCHDSVNSGLNC